MHPITARLFADLPQFHSVDPAGSQWLAQRGIDMPAGDFSLAVGPHILDWIADHVTAETRSIETGAGYTTVLLAALVQRHRCHTASPTEAERISAYLQSLGFPADRVLFAIGGSDQTLPEIPFGERFDFAYIDGCHGYPFPALDWHYIDLHLQVGGILGMDNAEIRPVREHCEFLEENGAYTPMEALVDDRFGYYVRFYRKLRDEPREWILQPYSVRHMA